MLTKLLNRLGLFTKSQYLEQVESKDRINEYALVLERAVNGMNDPAKPIIVLGNCVIVRDITLKQGQNIIVSPHAKYVQISNVLTIPEIEQSTGGAAC